MEERPGRFREGEATRLRQKQNRLVGRGAGQQHLDHRHSPGRGGGQSPEDAVGSRQVDQRRRQVQAGGLGGIYRAAGAPGRWRNSTCLRQGLPVSDFRGELAQPCKDGSTVWAELSMSGMINASYRFVGFLGVIATSPMAAAPRKKWSAWPSTTCSPSFPTGSC